VEANTGFRRTKQEFGQTTRHFRLADASRAQKEEAADRARRGLQAGAAAADGARERGDGFVLADDALVKFLLDAQELFLFVFLNGRNRDAGPARDDFFNVFTRHHTGGGVVELVAFAQQAQALLFLALLLGIKARLLEFVIGDGGFHAVGDELHAFLHFGDFFRHGGLAKFHARARFVDQINGLVGKEAVRDVAVREIHGVAQSLVRVRHGVKLLITLAHAVQDLDGLFFGWRGDFHGLEAALERAVWLHRLAVFAGRGGADAPDFPAGKRRLQNVGGVERTFRRSGTHQRVQFVDEDDGVLALHQLLHDRLQAFFKLAAVLRARDDERKVERKYLLVSEKRRNIAVGDALREPLDDGRLAHSGLADEHRIILRAAAENLDDALDLSLAAHERVERTFHGRLGQVAAELGKERGFLGAARRRFFAGSTLKLFPQGREAQPALHQDLRAKAFFLAQDAEQEMFGAHVLVTEALRLFGGHVEDALALGAERNFHRRRDAL